MLHAKCHHIFSWSFTLSQDGVALVQIDWLPWVGQRAEVKIGNQAYTACRESFWEGTYVLQSGDKVVARAKKVDSRAFELYFALRRVELRALSAWGKQQYGLFESEAQIGHISATEALRRKAVIDLPGDIPIPVQVFLFWLVVILWRQFTDSG